MCIYIEISFSNIIMLNPSFNKNQIYLYTCCTLQCEPYSLISSNIYNYFYVQSFLWTQHIVKTLIEPRKESRSGKRFHYVVCKDQSERNEEY